MTNEMNKMIVEIHEVFKGVLKFSEVIAIYNDYLSIIHENFNSDEKEILVIMLRDCKTIQNRMIDLSQIETIRELKNNVKKERTL